MTAIERIADLATALAGMRAAVAEGAAIDLAGLEGAVEAAMSAAKAAPAAEHAALDRAMRALVQELDQLSNALLRQHHAAAQQRALAAYGSPQPAPATPPDGTGGREEPTS
jgi:hypothetical protein